MVFQCQLSHAEMSEAYRINRTPVFWMKTAVANLRAIILILIVIFLGIAKVIKGEKGNWVPLVALVGFAAVLIALYLWRQRNTIKKAASQMNAVCSEMTLDASGVKLASAIGAMSFTPWPQFTGWKEGRLVFTVSDGKIFRTVPKSALTESQIGEVRGLLQSQIQPGARSFA